MHIETETNALDAKKKVLSNRRIEAQQTAFICPLTHHMYRWKQMLCCLSQTSALTTKFLALQTVHRDKGNAFCYNSSKSQSPKSIRVTTKHNVWSNEPSFQMNYCIIWPVNEGPSRAGYQNDWIINWSFRGPWEAHFQRNGCETSFQHWKACARAKKSWEKEGSDSMVSFLQRWISSSSR